MIVDGWIVEKIALSLILDHAHTYWDIALKRLGGEKAVVRIVSLKSFLAVQMKVLGNTADCKRIFLLLLRYQKVVGPVAADNSVILVWFFLILNFEHV